MKKRILLTAFLISLPFWWGVNVLEAKLVDFFFLGETAKNPNILTAQITPIKNTPDRISLSQDLTMSADSAIALFVSQNGNEAVLFFKDKNEKLPFASLAKLMTAKIVLDNYDLNEEITVSTEAVAQDEDFGQLEEGQTFPVEYLLYPLLMESSNDAAFALADDYKDITEAKFISMMNLEAQKLGLENTSFVDTTGLSPEIGEPKSKMNLSSTYDLAKLAKSLLGNSLLWDILATPEYSVYGPVLENTNKLLLDNSNGWRNEIIGGKTGYTDEAGECLLLVLRAPKNKGYIINVILGSDNRFLEMKQLVEWVKTSYVW